jgi:hypothetical protein
MPPDPHCPTCPTAGPPVPYVRASTTMNTTTHISHHAINQNTIHAGQNHRIITTLSAHSHPTATHYAH